MDWVAVKKQQVGKRRLGVEGLWDPQEMWADEDRRLHLVFYCRDRDEMGNWVWMRGKKEQRWSSVSFCLLVDQASVFTADVGGWDAGRSWGKGDWRVSFLIHWC